jgi:hypothetical protein
MFIYGAHLASIGPLTTSITIRVHYLPASGGHLQLETLALSWYNTNNVQIIQVLSEIDFLYTLIDAAESCNRFVSLYGIGHQDLYNTYSSVLTSITLKFDNAINLILSDILSGEYLNHYDFGFFFEGFDGDDFIVELNLSILGTTGVQIGRIVFFLSQSDYEYILSLIENMEFDETEIQILIDLIFVNAVMSRIIIIYVP